MFKIKSCIHSSSLDLKDNFLKTWYRVYYLSILVHILLNQYGTPGAMNKDELICQQSTRGKPLNLSLIGTSKIFRNFSYIIKLVDGETLGIQCVSSQ